MLNVQAERAAQPDLEVIAGEDVALDVLAQRVAVVVGLLSSGVQVEEVRPAGEDVAELLVPFLEREALLFHLLLEGLQDPLPFLLGLALPFPLALSLSNRPLQRFELLPRGLLQLLQSFSQLLDALGVRGARRQGHDADQRDRPTPSSCQHKRSMSLRGLGGNHGEWITPADVEGSHLPYDMYAHVCLGRRRSEWTREPLAGSPTTLLGLRREARRC